MLLEGLVAVVALATVMIVASDEIKGRTPGVLYGDGLATFITRFLDPEALRSGNVAGSAVFLFAATFGAMAFSTFVFDTLDVSTRLGRYLLCELVGTQSKAAGVVAAALTAGVPLAVLLAPTTSAAAGGGGPAGAGGPPAFMLFWTLFGTANQLLACLTLLGVTIWLYKTGRTIWYTLVPMVLLFAVTLSALGIQIFEGVRTVVRDGLVLVPPVLNAMVAVALLGLAAVFVVEAMRAVRVRPGA
jgi:carbon starvation protein